MNKHIAFKELVQHFDWMLDYLKSDDYELVALRMGSDKNPDSVTFEFKFKRVEQEADDGMD